ncbi:uncharacterized protein ARMOST_19833 [Armillaria ostoyae]|uniref:Uncharacterized protein n=1 Tax=Armillaria ostoyae TaxID=47428 RepID=A0A284S5P1_ARMOS|nr:uncharacterized protein ARMOST_19833 [Armillaria ostoyae]
MANAGPQMFILSNGSEFELFIDDDGDEGCEIPINPWPMEETDKEQPSEGHEELDEGSESNKRSESEDKEQSQSEDEQDHPQNIHVALQSDHAAYEFAIHEGGEWANPQADAQNVQDVLHEMSDEQ